MLKKKLISRLTLIPFLGFKVPALMERERLSPTAFGETPTVFTGIDCTLLCDRCHPGGNYVAKTGFRSRCNHDARRM